MPILIDGYNLMFAAGLIPRGIGPGTLERARRGLLKYLVYHLPPEEVDKTVIVFDAKDAPSDAGPEYAYHGMRILFARDHDEADDLIEQLIRHDSAPRQLVVVTSDWRLRTAAQRRRAQSIKSEDWLDQIERQLMSRSSQSVAASPARTSLRQLASLNDDDVAAWLEEFGLDSAAPGASSSSPPTSPETPSVATTTSNGEDEKICPPKEPPSPSETTPQTDRRNSPRDGDWGPFPPGYGEDLLQENEGEP